MLAGERGRIIHRRKQVVVCASECGIHRTLPTTLFAVSAVQNERYNSFKLLSQAGRERLSVQLHDLRKTAPAALALFRANNRIPVRIVRVANLYHIFHNFSAGPYFLLFRPSNSLHHFSQRHVIDLIL